MTYTNVKDDGISTPKINGKKFCYIVIMTGTVQYLVDVITTFPGLHYARMLSSDGKNNKYFVNWYYLKSNSWWKTWKREQELSLKGDDFTGAVSSHEIFEISVSFSKIPFSKLYLSIVPKIRSSIPNLTTTGPIQSSWQIKDINDSGRALMAFFEIKNLHRSRWIYLLAIGGDSYFEFALSKVFGLTGAVWLFQSPLLNEKHNSYLTFGRVAILDLDRIELAGPEASAEISVGKSHILTVLIKFNPTSLEILWTDQFKPSHRILTTLETSISVSRRDRGRIINQSWSRALVEINTNITENGVRS